MSFRLNKTDLDFYWTRVAGRLQQKTFSYRSSLKERIYTLDVAGHSTVQLVQASRSSIIPVIDTTTTSGVIDCDDAQLQPHTTEIFADKTVDSPEYGPVQESPTLERIVLTFDDKDDSSGGSNVDNDDDDEANDLSLQLDGMIFTLEAALAKTNIAATAARMRDLEQAQLNHASPATRSQKTDLVLCTKTQFPLDHIDVKDFIDTRLEWNRASASQRVGWKARCYLRYFREKTSSWVHNTPHPDKLLLKMRLNHLELPPEMHPFGSVYQLPNKC